MTGRSVVVGGGIAGLFGALLLARRHPQSRVTLIEHERELGGMLRSFDYGEAGRFDYGMHNVYDTGITEVDDLLFNALPSDEWQMLEGNRRDLAGVFFRGRLQSNSPYIDLRNVGQDRIRRYAEELFGTMVVAGESPVNALEAAAQRFGAEIANRQVAPILEKLYRCRPIDLDPIALKITPLDRVILCDEPLILDLMQSPILRERLAFPEQRRLPDQYVPTRRAYYPRRYGMYRLVDGLERQLREAGVEILKGARVMQMAIDDGRVVSLSVAHDEGNGSLEDIAAIYWTAGLPPLWSTIGGMPKPRFDRGPRTAVVSMLLDRPPRLGDLYYLYCYDSGFDAFRLTNYPAYSDGAVRPQGYPICLELLIHGDADEAAVETQARDELQRLGVLTPGTGIAFARAAFLSAGFPLPSRTNLDAFAHLRDGIQERRVRNLHVLGIFSEPGIFFQRDVLRQAHRTILSSTHRE